MLSARPFLLRPLAWLLVAFALLALAGCKRQTASREPGTAVLHLAEAIRDNDLVRYAHLKLPPDLYAKMDARWKARVATAPPPTAEQVRDYARWMDRFTAPNAEATLFASTEPKLKELEQQIGGQWPVMQATIGIFLTGVIQANDTLTDAEKAHAKAVASAFTAWVKADTFTDRARAKQAIHALAGAARDLELPTLADARKLEFEPALEKGSIGLRGLKAAARAYGIDIDTALDGIEAEVESEKGDTAIVAVEYPLLGKTIAFEMEMTRRDGRWYPADAVREAEAELAKPLTGPAPVVQPAAVAN